MSQAEPTSDAPGEPEDQRATVEFSIPREGKKVGRYKLLQVIGEGGFGVVYMAEQEHPVRRRVALKLVKAGMDTKAVIARFEAERQALAMMEHPNIARVLDGGATEQGYPYFVMELVNGVPITNYADTNRLTVQDRLELFIEVCRAVQHAHTKGIIHRDLKPGNILCSTQDGRALAKVIDFGIAKAMAARLTEKTLYTEFHQFIGTPQYMSPEQAEASLDIDTRSDVYSLGVMLYELLTGTTPFAAEELRSRGHEEMKRVIREVEPPKPSTRLSQSRDSLASVAQSRRTEPKRLDGLIRGELDWIVMKALDKDRARRYSSAGDLAEDVHRYLAGEKVLAAPPTVGYRFRKFAKKNKAILATAAAIFVVLAAGILISSIEAVRANKAEKLVQSQLSEVQQQRSEAQRQRDQAVDANQRLTAANGRIQRMASDQCADNGLRADETGDSGLALLWYARAIALDGEDEQRARVDRLRFAISFGRMLQPVDAPVPDTGLLVHAGMVLEYSPKVTLTDIKTGKVVRTLLNGPASYAEFSRDGKYIVAACSDGTARVWESATGRQTCEPLPHEAPIFITFTPDSKLVMTTVAKKMVFREVEGGRPVLGTPPYGWCRFGPDGKLIVIHTSEGTRIWDVASGQPVTPPFSSATEGYRVAYSPDGTMVATGGRAARVWDARTGSAVTPPLALGGDGWGVVEFSPDGRWLMTGNAAEWRIWNVKDGLPRTDLIKQSGSAFWGAFSPLGKYIATYSVSGAEGSSALIVTRRAETGKVVGSVMSRSLTRFGFSQDERKLITADTGEMWDIDSANPSAPLFQTNQPIKSIRFSPDGQRILTAMADGKMFIWDGQAQQQEQTTAARLAGPFGREDGMVPPAGPDFTADGAFIDCAGVRFDVRTGMEVSRPAGLPMTQCAVYAQSPDGRLLLVEIGGKLRLWDIQAAKTIGQPLAPPTDCTHVMAGRFNADGSRVAAAYRERLTVGMWDTATAEPVVLENYRGPPIPGKGIVDFTSDGKYLIAPRNAWIALWDARTGKMWYQTPAAAAANLTPDYTGVDYSAARAENGGAVLLVKPSEANILDLSLTQTRSSLVDRVDRPRIQESRFSRDGKYLATLYNPESDTSRYTDYLQRGHVHVWDVATGELLARLSIGNDLSDVDFSPDSSRLIIARGKSAEVWNFKPRQEPVQQLEELAQYMAGRRLDDQGHGRPIEVKELRLKLMESCPQVFQGGER